MSWNEFTNLLVGLNSDTPLGKIVAIRSENNPEILKRFTSEMKAERNRWRQENVEEVSREDYMKQMKELERALQRAFS